MALLGEERGMVGEKTSAEAHYTDVWPLQIHRIPELNITGSKITPRLCAAL